MLETVRKVLQRGPRPPVAPRVELEIARRLGLPDHDPLNPDRLAALAETIKESVQSEVVRRSLTWADRSARVSEAFSESDEEGLLRRLLPGLAGPGIQRWIHPQANLETLLSASGLASEGARRVDLLIAVPDGPNIAVEVDDPLKDQGTMAARDAALDRAGVKVVRVLNDEVRRGEGPGVDRLRVLLEGVRSSVGPEPGERERLVVVAPTEAARIQLGLLRAFEKGLLPVGGAWRIEVKDATGIGIEAVAAFLDLLLTACGIWGFPVPFTEAAIHHRTGSEEGLWARVLPGENGRCRVEPAKRSQTPFLLRLMSEPFVGPYAELPDPGSVARLVLRPSGLPCLIDDGRAYELVRSVVPEGRGDTGVMSRGLRVYLQDVFRKTEFREGQEQAILRCLAGKDTVVLLPTGAGKSLIYQMAGMLLPGVTLVVDPIVALIEDQIESLLEYGIERAVGIRFDRSRVQEAEGDLQEAKEGRHSFVLVSPERLQIPSFREALASLRRTTVVNLAVIDESHCVSEWGHDFRPSYLRLGRNLRRFAADGARIPPPLLAMTGTASRAVLRDMLADLDIDRRDPGAVLTPRSFDRPELRYSVVRTTPQDRRGTLSAEIQRLPRRFREDPERFFAARGSRTCSGIVFCIHVNGQWGILDAAALAAPLLPTRPGLYSGGRVPDGQDQVTWERRKREDAAGFKTNRIPLLIATKAFGMGIDKPNIRFTLHAALPPSMEAFYQEAGRAGRDRRDSWCLLVFSSSNSERARRLLNPNTALDDVIREVDETAREGRDDVLNQLWFHNRSFPGVEAEAKVLDALLAALGWGPPFALSARTVRLPFDDARGKTRASGRRRSRDEDPAEGSRGGVERGLLRLEMIDLVEDYRVDFGGKYFEIDVAAFDPRRIVEAAHRYRVRLDAQLAARRRTELESWASLDPRSFVLRVVRSLLDDIYDTVERSRRRALYEMWNAAMQVADLAEGTMQDRELRSRLLNYLREGDLDGEIERLRALPSLAFDPWFQMLRGIHDPIEANEVRQKVIRHLEAYPDDPGLLYLRGGVEAFFPRDGAERRGALHDLEANLLAALRRGRTKYGVAEEGAAQALDRLFGVAAAQCQEWRADLFRIAEVAARENLVSMERLHDWSEHLFSLPADVRNYIHAAAFRLERAALAVHEALSSYGSR